MLERGDNWIVTDELHVQLFTTAGIGGHDIWHLDGEKIQAKPGSDYVASVAKRLARAIPGVRITEARVSPEVGVLLYLQREGGLTLEHLKNSAETRDTIVCRGVTIGGIVYDLTIRRGMSPWKPVVISDAGADFS